MKNYDPLTARFPRTVTEAFGCDAQSAYAVERYQDRTYLLAKWLVRVIILTAVAGAVVLGVLT